MAVNFDPMANIGQAGDDLTSAMNSAGNDINNPAAEAKDQQAMDTALNKIRLASKEEQLISQLIQDEIKNMG